MFIFKRRGDVLLMVVLCLTGCGTEVAKQVPIAPPPLAEKPMVMPSITRHSQSLDEIGPGSICVVRDGWWALEKGHPIQPEFVLVDEKRRLVDGREGVWIRPTRGPLTGHLYQIALDRLTDCRG